MQKDKVAPQTQETDELNRSFEAWRADETDVSPNGNFSATNPPVYEYSEPARPAERGHLIDICVKTEAQFPGAIASFENARHILYEQVTGKTYGRSPNVQSDSSFSYEEAFRIPKSQARPLVDDLPSGYSFDDTEKNRQMLAENDLLIQAPNGEEISMFGDLPDVAVEGREFETVKVADSGGVDHEVKVETLTEHIKHTVLHMLYENDLLRLSSDGGPDPYQQYSIDKLGVEAQKVLEMIAVAPAKVDDEALIADPMFSDYVAALELMAASGKYGANYLPTTTEEQRTEAKAKVEAYFKAKEHLAEGKRMMLADLKTYFDISKDPNGQATIPDALAAVLSGYEDAVQVALAKSVNSDEFVKNFMIAAREQDQDIDDVLTDRLSAL
jgi:hypothetical protein